MYFQKFPLVRLVIAFALGIISRHYVPLDLRVPLVFFAAFILLLTLLNWKLSIKANYLFGGIVLLVFFLLGALRLDEKLEAENHLLLRNQDLSEIIAYKAWLYESPDKKKRSYKLTLEVISVFTKCEEKPAEAKLILYTDSISGSKLQAGDIVFVPSAPLPTESPANPGEFDYQEYLSFQGVRFQHYAKNVLKIGSDPINPVWKFSQHLREKAKGVFEQYIQCPKARSIAMALVLGQKDELDEEISKAFSAAGAMHVLAVSGLHVGLIYLLFSLVFKRLPYSIRRYRWLEALLSIIILMAYAILTGMSPSVMRAVTMFVFMAIGKASAQVSNIYNSLAASALVLLLIDPYLIMSVGFQLSYLAVIGIVYLQPKLYALLTIRNWMLDKLWSITCVSLAAQLATAPLSMLYFHQFPSYFLLANLFIIPAAFVILIGGLGLIAFSFIPFVAELIGVFLSTFISITNGVVGWVSELPFGQIQGIQLTVFETWLIYGLIVLLVYAFQYRKLRPFYLAVVFSLIFCISQLYQRVPSISEREITIFDISGEQTIQFRKGNRGMLIADSTLVNDLDRLSFHVYPSRLVNHMPLHPQEDELLIPSYRLDHGNVFVFNGMKILQLETGFKDYHLIAGLEWDICLTNSLFGMEKLKAKEIVLNSKRYGNTGSLEVSVHSIVENGFYSKSW